MSPDDGEVRPRRSRGSRSGSRPAGAGASAEQGEEHSAAKKATPKKAAAKKAAAKKAAAKKATPKKATKRTTTGERHRGGIVVAVTGAARGLGEAFVQRLAAPDAAVAGAIKRVVAIDTIRGDAPHAIWRLADVRDPALADRLSGVDVVVHLAVDWAVESDAEERRATNVRGTATVLTAAAAAGVKHVVLTTSTMVYGALPDNAVPLPEDAELKAVPDAGVIGDLLEIEELAQQAPRTHPALSVTVLRPAALVGPGIDTIVTRHFEAPWLLAVKGSHTCWQFCHLDDLMSALEAVVMRAADAAAGADHDAAERWVAMVVASDGGLTQADAERISGKRHIELPPSVAFGTAERLHRFGVTPASASDLQYVVHPWVVDATKLATYGWAPRHSNEDVLEALLSGAAGRFAIGGHRLGRRDAAAGAAVGATVALVGTAALVRRARRRRRA